MMEVHSHRDEALTSQEGHEDWDPGRLNSCKGCQSSVQQRDKVMVRPQLVVQRLRLDLGRSIQLDTSLVKLRGVRARCHGRDASVRDSLDKRTQSG
jgi:hypothetical protein